MSTADERSREEKMTEVPQTINAADIAEFTDEVDVLVIGFGIAGGCAAVSAAAAGAKVLVPGARSGRGRHQRDGGWPFLSRRWHRGATGHRP